MKVGGSMIFETASLFSPFSSLAIEEQANDFNEKGLEFNIKKTTLINL